MAKARALQVGTAVARRGRWTKGELVLGHYPDAPITTPVNIMCGAKPGPVLWVQACIHGTEVGGAMGLLRLFKKLDPAKMSGTIIAIMATNPTAFRGFARNTPLDGENLNRLFPGDAKGPHSRQAAHTLFKTAMAVSDAMIDLHSGGDEAEVPFYAIYWNDGSEAGNQSARLARAAATPDIWASRDAWLGGCMMANYTRQGKPALIVECGGGGQVPEAHIDNYVNTVSGVAKAMGILPGRPPKQKKYRVVGECLLVFNKRGGYFLPAVEVGSVVKKGQIFGRIMDPHGRIIEELKSPNGPAYVAALVRPYLPVYSGAMVAETIDVLEDR
ncbi:MAG TPA: succinylglutamate desuccinylase/aspartoacylase family protein [Alphaproteobacteria bacterium]|jgi:predicted deacylase|nr:succinylglutamate desuccinylase/aspartoacylase family protein [Alphaproteobacteria bacterium]MDP6270753.1 succinylglutamate desuccinylase/aspartoacylase family protein [Alphaproteobacteria bacterium]MDP7426622.1 succinylglutamate desuccinylase/aspartoacylase family protein [Alphaproteobacteria bacterium]HJM50306.1 succinylglutamate desuccinylase/aspartoacylase family protein [Alphaproteobacteria bacterium]|tara:strand:- start:61 stop:1047 length:987 start_codon:yes stop_codon:yes gene_type:complete